MTKVKFVSEDGDMVFCSGCEAQLEINSKRSVDNNDAIPSFLCSCENTKTRSYNRRLIKSDHLFSELLSPTFSLGSI